MGNIKIIHKCERHHVGFGEEPMMSAWVALTIIQMQSKVVYYGVLER